MSKYQKWFNIIGYLNSYTTVGHSRYVMSDSEFHTCKSDEADTRSALQ